MEQSDYKAMWLKLFEESHELLNERTRLENELNDLSAKLHNVERTLEHLRPLAGITGDDLSGVGLTDAIRAVLKKATERMSANDVRHSLSAKGFDLSRYTSPMSSIYTVLGRLSEDGGEVIREKEGNQVFYRWAENNFSPTEISDDDIPF